MTISLSSLPRSRPADHPRVVGPLRRVTTWSGPGHIDLATTDPQQAYDFLNGMHGVDLELDGLAPGDFVSVVGDDIGAVRFSRFRSPARLRWQIPPLDEVIVSRPLAGFQRRETGAVRDRLTSGDVAVLTPPDRPARGTNEGLSAQTVAIDVGLLTEVAANDPESPPSVASRFRDCHPVVEADAERWRRVVQLAEDLTARGEDSTMLRGETSRFVAASVLTLFGAHVSDAVVSDRTDATPWTLRRAMEFIDAHAAEDISVTQIAAEAGVTVRAIQLAFRHHLQVTPLAHLRRVRLERAHEELSVADPAGGSSVTAIAARWGFYSHGRFSAAYREVYGELPSRTFRG